MKRGIDSETGRISGEGRAAKILKRLGIGGKASGSKEESTGAGSTASGGTSAGSARKVRGRAGVRVKKADVINALNELKQATSMDEVLASGSKAKKILKLYRETHRNCDQ